MAVLPSQAWQPFSYVTKFDGSGPTDLIALLPILPSGVDYLINGMTVINANVSVEYIRIILAQNPGGVNVSALLNVNKPTGVPLLPTHVETNLPKENLDFRSTFFTHRDDMGNEFMLVPTNHTLYVYNSVQDVEIICHGFKK